MGGGRSLSRVATFWPCQPVGARKEPELGLLKNPTEQQPSSTEDPRGVGDPVVRSNDGADRIGSLFSPQGSAIHRQEGTREGADPDMGTSRPLRLSLRQGSRPC